MLRGTFAYQQNRNGVPWRATDYYCEHGNSMVECTVGDDNHRATGQAMLDWINDRPTQQFQRTVTRNNILNGGEINNGDCAGRDD